MLKQAFLSTLLLSALSVQAQEKSFTIEGIVPLPDGYNASLLCHTDTAYSTMMAESWVKDGKFLLTGRVDKPYQGTLMTNNLQLVEQNKWPTDSIRWTYTPVFVSSGDLEFGVAVESSDQPLEVALALTGTQVQADYNELRRLGGERDADAWAFIGSHPQSVISVWLGNRLMERAYNLTADQVEFLAQTVKGSSEDPQRFALFQKQLAAARKTVKDSPLTDLELVDAAGNPCHLTDVMPRNGKYVLIDFWASWCGICIHAMPDVAKLAEDFKDRFEVIAVSIDTKADAWHKAMEKHPEPWPQYCTTKVGYQDLFDKYQVGNGVPYYLLVSPEGKVLFSPSGPEAVRAFLEETKG